MKIRNDYDSLTVSDAEGIDRIRKSDGDDVDKLAAILSLLSDTPESAIRKMDVADFTEACRGLSFLTEEMKPQLGAKWAIDGRRYAVCYDIAHVTLAQYQDFTTLMGSGSPDRTYRLLAVFIVPEGHTYADGYDIGQVVEDAKRFPARRAAGLSAFFTQFLTSYLKTTLTYLTRKVKRLGTRGLTQGQRAERTAALKAAERLRKAKFLR